MTSNNIQKTNQHNIKAVKEKLFKKEELNENHADSLLFSSLLQSDTKLNNIMQVMEKQNNNNQQDNNDKDDSKQESVEIVNVDKANSKQITDIAASDKAQIAEFSKALQQNHQKHFFEVSLPKLGQFKVSTEFTGKNLNFKVDAQEKMASDWLKQHNGTIASNISKDLGLNVNLNVS
jgi:hypothetical protein